MWQLAPAELAHELRLATEEVGDATCIACGAPTTMLNRAIGVGVDRPATDDDLGAITSFFAKRETRFAIPVAPGAQPDSLEDRLLERGFERGYAWMKFRRGTDDSGEVSTDLRIEEIGPERGDHFGLVVAEAFGLPPMFGRLWVRVAGEPGWHCFVGYADGEPAATGALYVEGSIGWLGAAGTRARFRGRGGQNAVLATRIAAAKRLGVEVLVTETGERLPDRPSASYRNILRAGFEEAYLRPSYELDTKRDRPHTGSVP